MLQSQTLNLIYILTLNFPAENVWGMMTNALTPELNGAVVNSDELWQRVQATTPQLCESLAREV